MIVIESLATDGAACCLYRDAPSWNGMKTASVGSFRCDNWQDGERLLNAVGTLLRHEGYEAAIGPMDGDTWHRYRLVAESDGSAPFLMEPVSGPYDKAAFEASGFASISSYASSRTSLNEAIGTSPPAAMDGVSITAWNGNDAHSLIGGLADIAVESFKGNPFFKPITKSAVLQLYEPLLPSIDPRLVFFAHDKSGRIGFLFGLPNRMEGSRPSSVILKTYAATRRGVGHLLADRFHRTAKELGFVNVIYAPMHIDNVSFQRTARYGGRVFRRYALMGKKLA